VRRLSSRADGIVSPLGCRRMGEKAVFIEGLSCLADARDEGHCLLRPAGWWGVMSIAAPQAGAHWNICCPARLVVLYLMRIT